MDHHISQDIDSFIEKIRCTFDIIDDVISGSIGIKFTSEGIYCLSNCLGSRIFLASFEKKMFQEVADAGSMSLFIDTSCFDHYFNGNRISVFYRGQKTVYTRDFLDFVLHNHEKE
jgi:hypothetical protein